ncbi:Type I restriction modification DNA specificity domain protein [Haemophilus influenzae]|nr:Type I restriction modification DNA specificity domain protein [Haemophilus influenzae]
MRSKYLYYWFSSPVGRKALKEITIGSTQPALTITGLKSLTIHLPTLEEQDYIIEILDHLSSKIQLNTQINQTLEQIAQALFKSWFVDFDPVRAKVQALSDGLSFEQAELAAMQAISGKTPEELTALSQTQPDRYTELVETAKAFPCEMVEVDGVEVPKGWGVKPLGDLISFVKGKKPKAVSPNQEENMLPHILTSSLEGKYNEFCESNKLVTVEYHNTIMLMDGSNSGRVAIGHNGVIGSTLAKINLDNNKLWAVIYQFLKHKEADIQANTTGTTIPHTDKNRVNNYLMVIPDNFLLEKFTELFDNSLLKIISNRNQIISLETTRDLLLPRLLNGEIQL